MENASKALIIAGAILISILLISVGIIIMNAINDPVSSAGDSAASQAIDMFNSKFTAYEGKQKGSTLKSLASTVNSSNATDDEHLVRVSTTIQNISSISDLKSSTEYKVTINYATGTSDAYTGTKIAGDTGTNPTTKKGYVYEIVIGQ